MSVFRVFLARIFPRSDWIRRDTEYLSVFSPNVGKYGPEKLHTDTFYAVNLLMKKISIYHLLRKLKALKIQYPTISLMMKYFRLSLDLWKYSQKILNY